jgi:hypothetical protein
LRLLILLLNALLWSVLHTTLLHTTLLHPALLHILNQLPLDWLFSCILWFLVYSIWGLFRFLRNGGRRQWLLDG